MCCNHQTFGLQLLQENFMMQGNDGSPPEWPADRLLFSNDVFFCAWHIWRLLQHSASIVCGLDFNDPAYDGIHPSFYDRW